MNKLFRIAGILLLVCALIGALAACGEPAQPTQTSAQTTAEPENKEIVVETPPPSPTPAATPTPEVPPVAVTTVPMPMPSVSPTPGVTTTDAATTTAAPDASPVASPTPSPSPSASAAPVYSADAAFASTIRPDGALVPDSAVPGYVSGNGVAFRAGPNASARIISTLYYGNYVEIVGTENGWTEVIIGGMYGYIASQYVVYGSYYNNSPSGFIGSSSGTTIVVVPSGQTGGTVVVNPDETNFLGIRPD